MKYFVLGILIISILCFFIWYFLRKRWAIKKVKCQKDSEKLCSINKVLAPFGFAFDLEEDIVISRNDAWQRNFGYMDLYDSKAPFFAMVMDAQPIYFDYNCKHYRIEFWKGQYGITTGGEVGVYIRKEDSISKDVYRACTDEERLDIYFVLSKKCQLFSRCGTSWWLTGFDIGLFSKPKDLKMGVCINFPDCKMRNAFVHAMIEAGYSKNSLCVCNNMVCFDYCAPSSYYKPNCSHRIVKFIAQIFNCINCHTYMFLTRPFNRTIDKLSYLSYMCPCLYRLIIKLCIPRRKQKCYHK